MISICKADHFAAPQWLKKLRSMMARLFTPVIRCAHCRKGFTQSEHMWSLGPNCSVYHDRCFSEIASPGVAS